MLQCALTKLSYLLSKPELTTADIRKLVSTPLRGELTRQSATNVSQTTINQNIENIQGLLSEFVRLSGWASQKPQITISLPNEAEDAAASWTSTAAEAASTEAVLLPFLIHAAAARNDVEGIKYCLEAEATNDSLATPGPSNVASGLVNAVDSASGGSPLHAAALNGSAECVDILLHSGALVHLRDTLGHTALYYVCITFFPEQVLSLSRRQAARKGHENIVTMLVQAGASLGGLDGGFAALAVQTAARNADQVSLNIWSQAGMREESP